MRFELMARRGDEIASGAKALEFLESLMYGLKPVPFTAEGFSAAWPARYAHFLR
jgi:hypothetical protein